LRERSLITHPVGVDNMKFSSALAVQKNKKMMIVFKLLCEVVVVL
jgi:hypothetical protein